MNEAKPCIKTMPINQCRNEDVQGDSRWKDNRAGSVVACSSREQMSNHHPPRKGQRTTSDTSNAPTFVKTPTNVSSLSGVGAPARPPMLPAIAKYVKAHTATTPYPESVVMSHENDRFAPILSDFPIIQNRPVECSDVRDRAAHQNKYTLSKLSQ